MELTRSIPKSINYQDVLPVAVPAVARRKKFYPANGTTFNFTGSNEIRVEIGSPNSMLDAQHSYIEFFVQNNTAQTIGFDLGGGHAMFREVRVEQGGRVIAREQEHNRLHAAILSATQTNSDGQLTESATQMQKGCNAPGGGQAAQLTPAPAALQNGEVFVNLAHNAQNQLPAGDACKFVMAMPTGLFTQDKLLPLPLVRQDSPITLVFLLDSPDTVGAWNAAPVGTLDIIRFNYIAQMIEVGGDVLQQVRMMQDMGGGQLTISSTDIEHNSTTLPNGATGEVPVRIPIRKRSMKSLLFVCHSEDYGNGGAGGAEENMFSLSFAGNISMENYQLKVGSVVYPPTPINCWGSPARAVTAARGLPIGERGECALELAKALGSLGFSNPTGRLSGITYGVNPQRAVALGEPELTDGDNGNGAAPIGPITNEIQSICPFGLDLDAFQHTAIESGVDSETMAMDTNLILNIAGAGAGVETKTVESYLIYDQHYYFNSDGSVTFSN